MTFFDETAFLAATGATENGSVPNSGNVGSSASIGNLNFESINNQNLYFGTGSAGLKLGGSSGTHIYDWSPLIAGFDIAISGKEDLRITVIPSSSSIFAFGFDFAEPTDATTNVLEVNRIDSLFEVRLYNNLDLGDAFTFNAPDDEAYFVGAWTDFPFNKVEIIETGGIDNEFFGEFFTGSTPIPEPATLFLLGTGIFCLAGLGRKKLKRK